MLFIHPMWDSESQRIGMQKCTPAGYALRGIGELIGFAGLLLLLPASAFLLWRWSVGAFDAWLWWLLAVPFGFGIISEGLVQCSGWMALRKGYHYDDELREASWLEQGKRRSFKYVAGERAESDQYRL